MGKTLDHVLCLSESESESEIRTLGGCGGVVVTRVEMWPGKADHALQYTFWNIIFILNFCIFLFSYYSLEKRRCAILLCMNATMHNRVGLITPSLWFKLLPLVFVFLLVYHLRKHLSFSIFDWFWGVSNSLLSFSGDFEQFLDFSQNWWARLS